MELIANPKTWIVAGAVAGFVAAGFPGMLIGGVGLYVVTFLVGLLIRTGGGGSVPRKVRRDLAVNVIATYPDAVTAAFPQLSGDELCKAIEKEVEEVIRRAATIAPSHGHIYSESVVRAALRQLVLEEQNALRQLMLLVLGKRLLRDWYSPS